MITAGSLRGAAAGQNRNWEYAASIYLFGARTETTTGNVIDPVSAEVRFFDAPEYLEAAFMGAFEASDQESSSSDTTRLTTCNGTFIQPRPEPGWCLRQWARAIAVDLLPALSSIRS